MLLKKKEKYREKVEYFMVEEKVPEIKSCLLIKKEELFQKKKKKVQKHHR